jgi:hypothetical protein
VQSEMVVSSTLEVTSFEVVDSVPFAAQTNSELAQSLVASSVVARTASLPLAVAESFAPVVEVHKLAAVVATCTSVAPPGHM